MREKSLGIEEIIKDKNKDEDFIQASYYKIKKLIADILKNIINYLEDDLALTILFSNLCIDEEKNQLINDFKDLLDKYDEKKNYNGIKYIYFGFKLNF